ncbi:MAG: P1 family peptidase [Planctomycetota bacterium]
MSERKRVRELGIIIGNAAPGQLNAITDVPGVLVGHSTLYEPDKGFATGVTAILPHSDNTFYRKVRAGSHIINGFGKPIGLVQISELGTIETPIILTNTLQVGMAADTLIRYMLARTPEICSSSGTVNPVVLECCDMYLSDSRSLPLGSEHILQAVNSAKGGVVPQGCVGAGMGMRCLRFKSGIGTASRIISSKHGKYILGVLVLSNFGHYETDCLLINGVKIPSPDKGEPLDPASSIIVVIATDAPLDARQLSRISSRTQAGIAKVGSVFTNASGDFAVAFTTSNEMPIEDKDMELYFCACVEVAEEAILDSIFCATTTRGYKGHISHAIDSQQALQLLQSHKQR